MPMMIRIVDRQTNETLCFGPVSVRYADLIDKTRLVLTHPNEEFELADLAHEGRLVKEGTCLLGYHKPTKQFGYYDPDEEITTQGLPTASITPLSMLPAEAGNRWDFKMEELS